MPDRERLLRDHDARRVREDKILRRIAIAEVAHRRLTGNPIESVGKILQDRIPGAESHSAFHVEADQQRDARRTHLRRQKQLLAFTIAAAVWLAALAVAWALLAR